MIRLPFRLLLALAAMWAVRLVLYQVHWVAPGPMAAWCLALGAPLVCGLAGGLVLVWGPPARGRLLLVTVVALDLLFVVVLTVSGTRAGFLGWLMLGLTVALGAALPSCLLPWMSRPEGEQ